MNVKDLLEKAGKATRDQVATMLEEERAGDNRTTAVEGLEARLAELDARDDDGDAGDAGESGDEEYFNPHADPDTLRTGTDDGAMPADQTYEPTDVGESTAPGTVEAELARRQPDSLEQVSERAAVQTDHDSVEPPLVHNDTEHFADFEIPSRNAAREALARRGQTA